METLRLLVNVPLSDSSILSKTSAKGSVTQKLFQSSNMTLTGALQDGL